MTKSKKFILWFNQIGMKDLALVGGKNASLGEMYRKLTKKGINIPNGFAVTSYAYKYFLRITGVGKKIKEIMAGLNVKDIKNLKETGRGIRAEILRVELPEELKEAIKKAYQKLCKEYKTDAADVAVRSSATAEDLPTASFAGQLETFLNIRGEDQLLKAVKKSFASLFTDRVISYRADKGISQLKSFISVGVQKMIRSDLASAGVGFSLDTETGFMDVDVINASYGLGENVVKGVVTPDEYFVFEPTLRQAQGKLYKPIIGRTLGTKEKKLIYAKKGTRNIRVSEQDQRKFVLTDEEILTLARWIVLIEGHYKRPMDVEWAKDGLDKKLYILQARPETVHSQKDWTILEKYILTKKGKILVTGQAIGDKIGQGKANVIQDVKDITKFKPGQVLVTRMTDPDWLPIMRMSSAIVTNAGGRTCFTGDTKILTDKGLLPIKEIYDRMANSEDLQTLSLDCQKNKIVWRPIIRATKRKSQVQKFLVSPALKSKQNFLEVTPDHEFLTLKDRKLVKKPIDSLVSSKEGVLVANRIPFCFQKHFNEKEFYLLGALLSDGWASINRWGGYTVGFAQKTIPEKKKFIKTTLTYFKEVYKERVKPTLSNNRDDNVISFKCYRKKAYEKLQQQKKTLLQDLLSADERNLSMFLAGVLDGDGNVSDHQIQITVGQNKRLVLDAVIIASLRLGLVPTVCKEKNWFVISFSEKNVGKLLEFTQRIKNNPCSTDPESIRRFISKQVIGDIIDSINQRGRMKHDYMVKGCMISVYKMNKSILPKVNDCHEEVEALINADFHMNRVRFQSSSKIPKDVYNLTIEAENELDHNYVVFTANYTPVIVGNCHAAIVSRELGIPCVVGTGNGTEVIKPTQNVTVSCAEGQEGRVYQGILPFRIKRTNLKKFRKPKTKIMMNLGNPEQAFGFSFIPNDGIGLAREEFIISNYIGIHPLALINFRKLGDKKVKEKIKKLTYGWQDKHQFFIDKLAEGIGRIAAAFYPKEVIVRTSDFKTSEYASLIGGEIFEPKEANPMIGWRGASRYTDSKFEPAFGLECKALKKVREVMGLKNVKIMIPFCRTPEEGKKVLKIMAKYGLKQGEDGLEVYVMAELPSNIWLADEFAQIFDGYSLGSNDLTQLTLGLDRDSALVAHIFDERNEAVKRSVAHLIKTAHKYKKKVGICGDAPSSYPDFAQFLVACGIDSISLSPDAVIKTTLSILKKERELKRKK